MEIRPATAGERRAAALALAAGLVAALLLALAPPGAYPIPDCPFHAVTGGYCPGCGSLRATHSLLDGHLHAAVGYNLLFVLSLPLFAWWAAGWVGAAVVGKTWKTASTPRLGWVLLGAVLVWWVVRNLPWGAFEVLRPVAGNPLLG